MDPCRLENSIQRGGSTFFFNPAVLLRIPQTIARVGNRFVRRSDMLVSQLMRDQLGLRIIMHPAAGVTHSRTHTHKTTPEDRTLGDDVLGYALCRTAEEIASSLPAEQRGQPLLSFSNEEAAQAIRRFTKYLNERLASVKLSGWRILGLAKTIRFTAASLLSPSSAWATDPSRESLNRLVNEMDGIIDMYRPEDVANRCESVRSGVTDRDIRNAFLSMEGLVTEYLETYSDYRAEDDKRTELRKTRARALLAREYGITSPRLLGLGGEGIAFTDDVRVYKVLDILKRRPNHDTLQTLRTLVKPSGDTKHLYALERVDEVDETIVVVYPFEKSEPYAGGHGRGLLEMLRECKAAGIVCRNIHPSNLRVTAGRPRLIDYGADIRPFSDAEFRAMSERTYLTWRWPHRNDLKDVMRRALQDKSLPELDGFDRFWNAVNNHGASASQVVLDLLDTERSIAAGARVLDYGCGSGLLVRQLTSNGCSVVGYDPDPERDKSWSQIQELPQGCRFTHNREDALASGPYECVTCTLVLCEVPDGPVYEQALADIRQSVTANGSVHIVVCNPFSVFAGPTRLHPERRLPGGAQYEDCFPYHDVSTSGRARAEFHRPLSRLRRDLLRHHLIITEIRESQTVDFDRFEPASDFLLLRCQPVQIANPSREISLVIKTCALESKTIEVQVEHLVGQLESPRVFRERILAIDPKMDGFARQYRDIVPSDLQELQNAAKRLVKRGLIDRIILGPTDPGELRSINREWFGLDLAASHSARNTPMAAQLVAFENASCEFVLQVDADLIVYRQDRAHDYLGEMIGAIDAAPRALTASLNVAQDRDIPYSFNDGTRPWRVEVRGCLFHRERLLRARPFPNPEVDGQPARPWHRSMDIAAADGRFLSLRGGGSSTFFVHPPNIVKDSAGDWLLLYDLAEKGHRPPSAQIGKVELQGKKDDSLPKARVEPYVFILTGRNVPPGRVRRCLHSLAKQEGNWGAVIMDDASDPLCRDYLAELAAHHDSRITMIHAPAHRGQIANMLTAIGHICANPDSVMITLDLDDALLGSQVISRLEQEYSAGADVTIGTMLRTDKHKAYPVQFVDARKVRGGGNVWQHLRTFRKRLFDSVPKSALKLDNGCFVDVAVDWAFMLPIVEMAKHPVWIQEPLYLYEPSMMLGQGPRRADRDAQITQIVARTPLCDPSLLASPSLLTPEQITCLGKHMSNGVLFIRHAHRPGFAGLTEEARDAVPLTAEGVKEATRIGRYLPHFDRAVASPAPRSCMTAEFIAKGAGVTLNSPPKFQSLCRMRGANPAYEEYKKKHGWKELLRAWFKDETPPHVVVPVHEVVRGMCEDAELWLRDSGDGLIVAVTHDFAIAGLLAVLAGSKSTTVPYLSGVFVTADTMHNYFANKERR